MFSFRDIESHSKVIDENEFFTQYFNPDLPLRYDSNFFQLKYQPTLAEFELIEEMQYQYHKTEGLEHLKFYWPENKGFTPEIVAYFEKEKYAIELLELYTINPNHFYSVKPTDTIEVFCLSRENFEDFKQMNYLNDLAYGKDFADMKQGMYEQMLDSPTIIPYIAYIDNEPAGSLISISGNKTVEIDDLMTMKSFRKRGIATALQKAVMNFAKTNSKQVLLVADGDDTPKQMYLKQNYTYVSFRLGAQKVFTD